MSEEDFVEEADEGEETASEVDNIASDIKKAMDGLEEKEEPAVKTADAAEEDATEIVEEKQLPPPPQSLTAEEKAEWANLSDRAREIITRRESDYHKAITNQDGERLFGRSIKEVITPYMAEISAAGSTPAQTVGNLLNTVYQLKNGSDSQKVVIIQQIAKDYGVSLDAVAASEEYVDPSFAALQREIEQLKKNADPNAIKQTLTQELENARINAEISAFASDPANTHFEQVRPLMAAILHNGTGKTLKEAYDIACKADPQISSMLEAQKNAELKAKQKQEIAAKKRAASSVSGSPAISNSAKTHPNQSSSITDDLRAVWDDLESSV